MFLEIVTLFVAASVIFLVLDGIMLTQVIKPLFLKHLGDQMFESGFRTLPAILFYLVNMVGILYFAAWPAWVAGVPGAALVDGAILGLVAYGCYELTSWTVMKRWSGAMVAVDLSWGVVLSALSAWGGVLIAGWLL